MPSLDIMGVGKNFGSIHALKDITLNVDTPQCIGILGPNGAGKTTLLKIITNILKPSEGKILVNGINVNQNPTRALEKMGALVEQPEFYPYLTGRETMKFVARIKGMSLSRSYEEIEKLAKITGITEYLERRTGEYSRGMKQRLELAVSMIGDPEIIVLDEPTFGLDPRGMKEMRDILISLNEEKRRIILFSTHLISEAREVCDRVIIVDKGEIKFNEEISDLRGNKIRVKGNFKHLAKIDGAKEITTRGNEITVEMNPGATRNSILKELMEGGVEIDTVEGMDRMEEVYLSLVQ
ncbi:ABC transporter ATP-binding protein [Oxyplasma meridianum]|uniref:ABC transporter ATP-binding protein n=1 Tax=Oxyplasma meridianum TaxID=3073602 RepID=A0AAX4NEX5_9ARCH